MPHGLPGHLQLGGDRGGRAGGEALWDRDHPHTRGALCVKLNRYLEHTRAPDRLLYPLRRVGRKGEGRFVRTSWDGAYGRL